MNDRFVVGSVTGYPITPATLADPRNGREKTIWYVWDSAINYEIVGEFRNKGWRNGGISAEEQARALAASLNEP
jgi:hypothetical protein